MPVEDLNSAGALTKVPEDREAPFMPAAAQGWRPMDLEAERESRVAAIRAEFRAVAQSAGTAPCVSVSLVRSC